MELIELFEELLEIEWLNNTVEQYLYALAIFLIIYVALYIFKKFILTRLKKWAKKTKTTIDDELVRVIDKAPHSLYGFAGIYVAIRSLETADWINKASDVLLITLIVYWVTHIASHLIEYTLNKSNKNKSKSNNYFFIALLAKILIWSTGLLLVLSNLGVNISALVASMGIGGIAIALAVQNILGDIFSSFSIYFDKPFAVGDYIIIGDHQGTVKKIGLKTTRMQALQGEEIVISNKELTSTRVRNFKKMKKRRINFSFGVTYDTSSAKIEKIPKIIETIIGKIKMAEYERAHFNAFGDFSLNFEVIYYVTTREYMDYMNTQQEINFAIKRVFEKEKIHMAFPTQTLHIQRN